MCSCIGAVIGGILYFRYRKKAMAEQERWDLMLEFKDAMDSMVSALVAGYSMEKAVEIARSISGVPQTVLLSPACASFDMYSGFEERGRDFKRLVKELLK